MKSRLLYLREWISNSWIMRRLSSGYIVGTSIDDAVRACKTVERYEWSTTICPWHDTSDSVDTVASNYLLALESIIANKLDCYLSIKAWAINNDFEILRDILSLAESGSVRVHFDSLNLDTADANFELLEKSLAIYPQVSYTLPGRWRRSLSDAEKIIEFGIPVRIVKGESKDTMRPEINLRAGFFNLAKVLGGKAKHIDVATHDSKLAKETLMFLSAMRASSNLELLYGLPLRPVVHAQNLSVPIRIYIPYGYSMIGYGFRKIIKRPRAFIWMIKDFILGDKFRLSKIEKFYNAKVEI